MHSAHSPLTFLRRFIAPASVIVFFLVTVVASAQSIIPASLDFGDIEGNPVDGVPTKAARTITITNTSATEILTIYRVSSYTGTDTTLNLFGELGGDELYYLQPGEHRRYATEVYANEPEDIHGTMTFVTSYPSHHVHDTTIIPVHAHIVRDGKTYITHYDVTEAKTCDCYLHRVFKTPIYWVYPQIVNGTADTLRLDSIAKPDSSTGMGISDSVSTFDVIAHALADSSHTDRLPRDILPTMPLYFTIWFNTLPISDRFYLLRAYLTNKRTGQHFTLQDTIRGGVQRYLEHVVLSPSYGDHSAIRAGDADSISLGFSISTCTTPNDGPLTVERVYFRGQFQNDLTLLSSAPGRFIATPPQTLDCKRELFFRFNFAPASVGKSIDTAYVVYSFASASGVTVRDSNYMLLYLQSLGPNTVTITPINDQLRLVATPNPSPGSVVLHITGTDADNVTLQLYDAAGREAIGHALPFDVTGTLHIPSGTLAPGQYTVIARDHHGRTITTTSIVIVR